MDKISIDSECDRLMMGIEMGGGWEGWWPLQKFILEMRERGEEVREREELFTTLSEASLLE